MDRVEVQPISYPTNLLKKDWSKRKFYYRKGCAEFVDKVHEIEVKDDDVWLVTLPKCGTTWMQELLWLVLNGFDFETAKRVDLELRTPFLDFDYLIHADLARAFKPVEQLKSPRLIKTHLPLALLPEQLWHKKPKVIYVFRNPKDAATSMYYHSRNIGLNMDKTMDEFIETYIPKDGGTLLPIEHSTEFYALRHEPWLYYTSFERMKSNLRQVIEEVCTFLNKTIGEEQMQQMLQHLSFQQMKDNPMTNHRWEFEQSRVRLNIPFEHHNFIRKGKAGGYKEELSAEAILKLDTWLEQALRPHNITLDELLLQEPAPAPATE